MILDPYGEILAESRSIGNDMVVADLDAGILESSSGRRWLKARRPELYAPLTATSADLRPTREVHFGD